jgi:hypothetical protein
MFYSYMVSAYILKPNIMKFRKSNYQSNISHQNMYIHVQNKKEM